MEQFKEFVVKYFKIIVVVLSFSLTLYIQHVNNTAQIAELETKCIGLEVEIKNQYDRINAMKLDKSVFEATMMQLNTVQNAVSVLLQIYYIQVSNKSPYFPWQPSHNLFLSATKLIGEYLPSLLKTDGFLFF